MELTRNLSSLLYGIGKHQHCKDFLYEFTLLDPKQLRLFELPPRTPKGWLLGELWGRNARPFSSSLGLGLGRCLPTIPAPRLAVRRHEVPSEEEPGESSGPSPSLVRVFWKLEQNAADLFSQDYLPEINSITSGSCGSKTTRCNFSLVYQDICVGVHTDSF